jgi:hypothetical protein
MRPCHGRISFFGQARSHVILVKALAMVGPRDIAPEQPGKLRKKRPAPSGTQVFSAPRSGVFRAILGVVHAENQAIRGQNSGNLAGGLQGRADTAKPPRLV